MLVDAPRQGTDPVVMLDNVTKVYRMGGTEVRALDGVDLMIEAGSFWAIMGPSGSGKSTMLNLLGCLDRPSSGRYLLDGREVSHLDDDALSDYRLRRLGFIFQSFNLIAQLTVLENIELPLVYLDRSPEDCALRATELPSNPHTEGIGVHFPSPFWNSCLQCCPRMRLPAELSCCYQ